MSVAYRSTAYRATPTPRDRAISVVLALAIGALLIFALLRLGGDRGDGRAGDARPLAFDFLPRGDDAATPSPEREKQREEKTRPQPEKAPPPPKSDIVVPTPVRPVELPPIPGLIVMSRADFAKSDIGKIKGTGRDADADGQQVADAGGSAGGGIPGGGPGGETLYPAEWYREPTRAEMVTYLPEGRGEGWGMVACRTIARNRVEDCREMGESPGSGIARALRQAAWQFQILPPRVNGKPLLGVWVRVRFDILRGVEQ